MKEEREKSKKALDILDNYVHSVAFNYVHSVPLASSFNYKTNLIADARQALFDIIQKQPVYNLELTDDSILVVRYKDEPDLTAEWFERTEEHLRNFIKTTKYNVAVMFVPYETVEIANVISKD